MNLAEIHAAIPHRPPFLLVDEIVERDNHRIVCRKTFANDEWFFSGHYPDYPLVPGVLLCEAAMQAGAILLCRSNASIDDTVPVVTRMNDVRFKRTVRPGETIEMDVQFRERMGEAYFLNAKVTCDGKIAVRFEFACMFVAKTEALS